MRVNRMTYVVSGIATYPCTIAYEKTTRESTAAQGYWHQPSLPSISSRAR